MPLAPIQAPLYGLCATLLDGSRLELSTFAGKGLLIANTASRCGFTPQYAALEQIYRQYKDRGFVVLGFPCDQFGHQEPGSNAEIGAFCERNYGVTFPVFAKIDVNGPSADPVFRLLKRARRGLLGLGRIQWNFTKFLVDREGRIVSRHAPSTDPLKLRSRIERLL
ncbi:MAG TPA: glutathione peroxidase [Terracidiphilus sp.]|nr:glutathione peroxidase [Terracidiphilus sp.]